MKETFDVPVTGFEPATYTSRNPPASSSFIQGNLKRRFPRK